MKLGEIGGVPFYMNADQYEKWKHTDLTIDAVKGIGGMFSLDNGTGRRFLTKSEICLVVDNDQKINQTILLTWCLVRSSCNLTSFGCSFIKINCF